jgi:hypothetical protein
MLGIQLYKKLRKTRAWFVQKLSCFFRKFA